MAAAERLVILRGEEVPEERRDLAVLYCHAGMLREAKVELKAYAAAQATGGGGKKSSSSSSSKFSSSPSMPLKLSISPIGISIASSIEELPTAVLSDRLLTLLSQIPMEKLPEKSAGLLKPLNFEEAVRRCSQVGPAKILPLTW